MRESVRVGLQGGSRGGSAAARGGIHAAILGIRGRLGGKARPEWDRSSNGNTTRGSLSEGTDAVDKFFEARI